MKKIYKFLFQLGLISTDSYLNHLRKRGMKIGQGTKIFDHNFFIDEQRPYMIEIGKYCRITRGVIILQHDYSRAVLRRYYGDIVGESKKTVIGDNVFLGMNSIILMGTNIGNNVIVGAGSVVSGKIPDNVIVCGNPAKIVKTLDEHYETRKKLYVTEAIETFNEFYRKFNRDPTIKEMGAFWPLYMPKDIHILKKSGVFTNLSADNENEIIKHWLELEIPVFSSYNEFKIICKKNRN